MERKVYTLDDIPDDFDLTDNQWNQVHAHRSKRPIVDKEAIKSELDSLRFPYISLITKLLVLPFLLLMGMHHIKNTFSIFAPCFTRAGGKTRAL